MTFGEFAKQCELFEYSQEYFDLYKEASELDLMELYLNQQQFLAENAYVVESTGMNGYLVESAVDSIDDIEDRFYEAHNKFMKKVHKKISALMSAIARFFRNIVNRMTGKKLERESIQDAWKRGGTEAAIQAIWNSVKDNSGKIIAGLGIVGGTVGMAAGARSFHLDRAFKATIDTAIRKLGLNENEQILVMSMAYAHLGAENQFIPVKTGKKVLSPEQIERMDTVLKDMLEYAKGNATSSALDRANALAADIEKRANSGEAVEVACTATNYNEYANKFTAYVATMKAIEAIDLSQVPANAKMGAENAAAKEGEGKATPKRVYRLARSGFKAASSMHKDVTQILSVLHEAINDTSTFYAEWSSACNKAHYSLLKDLVKSGIDKLGNKVNETIGKVTGKNKKDKDGSEDSGEQEPAKDETPAEGATA